MEPMDAESVINGPDAAYEFGYACSSGAYDEEDNPFLEGTPEHGDWTLGFRDGERDIRDRIREWKKRNLNNHIVIVGSGRRTLMACETVCEMQRRVVIISSNAALCITARDLGCAIVVAEDEIPTREEFSQAAFDRASLVILTYDERSQTAEARTLLEILAQEEVFAGEVISIDENF